MKDFEFVTTHVGEENAEYYAADYMVNCDGEIIAFKLHKPDRNGWELVDKKNHPYQVFPRVADLIKV